MHHLHWLWLLLLLGAGCEGEFVHPSSLQNVRAAVRREFPEVVQVSTAELADRMKSATPPVLIGVRAAKEYRVSHLAGAQNVEPSTDPATALKDVPREAVVVVYCSVGYRSSIAARKLRAAGYGRVMNLDGSIFQWANEGRPVYREGKPVREVHPYSSEWGRLLAPSIPRSR